MGRFDEAAIKGSIKAPRKVRRYGTGYCRSYSPFPNRFRTVNPAFLASATDRGLVIAGELKVEMSFRTGFLQSGHLVNSGALSGRRRVNLPPQTAHSPSHSSY